LVRLIVDTVAPVGSQLDLSVTSDSGTVGDQITNAARVTLVGQTQANAEVLLVGPGSTALANNAGTFRFPGISLAVGDNLFTAETTDLAGNVASFQTTIHRLNVAAAADSVLYWNQVLLEAIRVDAPSPPVATRGMAMVSLAAFDAISAIEGKSGYYVSQTAPAGASADAAVAAGSHRVLVYLFPGQQPMLDLALADSLGQIPAGQGKTDGVELGESVGDAIIALRSTDGWNDFVPYNPAGGVGLWEPTFPMFDEALAPQWADLQPFAMQRPDQFLSPGPPPLDSAEYAAAVNEVQSVGRATGSSRDADQTQIARFWADGPGTYTPAGHWNKIAVQVATAQGNSLSENARLFALLNVAMADASIVAWNSKYHYEFWRPITAIQEADTDNNDLTVADPDWTSLLLTPPFPEYTSGHSTYSGAAAQILTSLFGVVPFTTTSLGLPGVQRSFATFQAAADEAGVSRIYGGIHFSFSNRDAKVAGRSLADYVHGSDSTRGRHHQPRTRPGVSAEPRDQRARAGQPIGRGPAGGSIRHGRLYKY